MLEVLCLVNTISSTSIPVEIANAVNRCSGVQVTVGAIMDHPDSDLDPDIRSMDVSVVYFQGQSNFDYQAYRRLWLHLQTESYDIIHTHHNFSGSVSRLLGRIEGVPVVNTEHNDLQHFTKQQRAANAATFGIPDVHIYNSNSTRSSRGPIERFLSNRDKVVYNGVDLDRIKAGADYYLPVDIPDGILITNVGVMTEQKNQKAILEAAHSLKSHIKRDDVYFVIAGSGPLFSELRRKAKRLQIDDMVYFTGYLPEREQIYKLLHQSDIFVSPSVYEGFCVAAVEAMAAGLPVIVSDIDVFHEVVDSPGIFVNQGDPTTLAKELNNLIQYQQRRERLGRLSKQRAHTNFSLEKTAKEYYKIYDGITA